MLRSIEIRGWRSYSPAGLRLQGLGAVNIIVGPNNAGKSNLFRFFHWLWRHRSPFRNATFSLDDLWGQRPGDIQAFLQEDR